MAFMFFGGKRRITKAFFVNSFGNNQTRGIYTFQLDVENGEILFKRHFSTPSDPLFAFNFGRFSCVTYRNRTGSVDDGGICEYAATAETLALVSRVSDQGKTYVYACTNGDLETADKLFAVDYHNGELVCFKIHKKKLLKKTGTYKFSGKGADEIRQTAPFPAMVDFLPDHNKLYVTCLGLDKICLFDIEDDGTLVYDNVHSFSLKAGNGPRKMIFNQNGDRAYVMNELSNTIEVYHYHDLTFELMQTVDTYPKEDDDEYDNVPTDIRFNFEQDHLYVTNKGHDSLVLFDIEEDGTLTYVDFEDTSPDPVNMLVYNEEGNEWVVVACQKGGIVESYRYSSDKGGMVIETKYSYMINEPVHMTPFINNY